ncbi:MJ0042 family finger-like domain-containing protein [Yoonia tamlensis]|uniref:MJ0042 family finger-like domain-containing protein n=1 Tax=Yoonia tamlensis TaxID=390270 RepID=A0A1I6HVX8_9RHOB|nr:zinc-ribbon domain-containing protein [Yoonia tamlensis]SFR58622.1 MJ0042 family finger-like domain-containing protein [Yoonia tamlensis]
MRLICPKCNAQYDIASDAIPAGGRDVQCSSCSHTWFQTEKAPEAASVVTPSAPPKAATDVQKAITKRKPLDSSIADILRQEAAREQAEAQASASPAAAPPPTSQSRPASPVGAEETRRRISMMAEQDANTPATVAAAATGAVADDANLRSVPSIDEINQQLRARSQSANGANLTEAEHQQVAERKGFRRGFAFVLILVAIAIAPYIFAEQILAQFPQYAGPMETYLEYVDTARLWLNEQYQTVQGMIADYTGAAETPATATPAPAIESAAPVAPEAPSE